MADVSFAGTTVTKEDITKHFSDGPGTISEIKIMNGFGFLEYVDPADARDVVPRTLSCLPYPLLSHGPSSPLPPSENRMEESP